MNIIQGNKHHKSPESILFGSFLLHSMKHEKCCKVTEEKDGGNF